MKKKDAAKYRELVERFDETLRKAGFVAESEQVEERNWLSWTWTRASALPMVQKVELLVKKPGLTEALANQQVYWQGQESEILVDGRTLTELGKVGQIEIGSGFLGSMVWGLARTRIAGGLRESLSWFEHFSSIPASIARVESGQTNLGTGEAARRVLRLLRNGPP